MQEVTPDFFAGEVPELLGNRIRHGFGDQGFPQPGGP